MSPLEIIFLIVVFLYSVVLHEVSHGFVAYSMGDNTARDLGRLTLNPLKHLDFFGSIILPLFLFLVGSPFLFGYAKPVPYNPLNLNDRKYGPAKVAIAGPIVNFILAVMFGLVLRFLPSSTGPALPILLGYIVQINLLLAIFNLVPIPPLDGHWILFTFLPARFDHVRQTLSRYGIFILLIFLFFIFPFILPLINFLYRVIVN
ncbi:MAG: site-2 protease family protein [Minisyncoccia bacterium]